MSENLLKLGLVPFFTQQLEDPDLLQERVGRVTSVQRSNLTVVCESAERVVGLSPALLQAAAMDRPTVGDWVVLDESLSLIRQVLERKSLFKRLGAGESSEVQPIAANIDILFIVTSCNDEFKESRLERYLALCAEAGAIPVIVLTKADLVEDVDEFIRRARSAQAGVAVETINALDPETVEGVRSWIGKSSTVALVGSSGVGKSTLLNTLAERQLAATGGIREQDTKGRHTTTHRELHVLPAGGLLIDVPGMRELRVAEIDQSLGTVFEDIEQLAESCRFADCQHEAEPGCAVLQAIEDNTLDSRRLANYKKLLRENAQATATLAEKRSQGRSFAKMVKNVKLMKQKKNDGE
ncbi:ribosome small subunit-dependent GTPase A [Pseudomaricurvus sp. HS19]|uniref:ribosome small subunit-dependent GTPase A n=1 Tax=Pseudomaricurvus sp. HS19 TaxID=2692626 RepID=UPI00136817E6|nr:ribosome small subunit-dependent GTPase A [Pseudomaricurvus sp. HS19]MYM63906.1 ribosome small subunit-dependent GTPase A [Pseudomaricurvus sp. HS19]